MPRQADFNQPLCPAMQGFSRHASVRCGADERQALEQPCRYIIRPSLANELVQTNAAGQVVLKPKTAWRDGTTHLVLSALEFMPALIECPLFGCQYEWHYVSSASIEDSHAHDFSAGKPTTPGTGRAPPDKGERQVDAGLIRIPALDFGLDAAAGHCLHRGGDTDAPLLTP